MSRAIAWRVAAGTMACATMALGAEDLEPRRDETIPAYRLRVEAAMEAPQSHAEQVADAMAAEERAEAVTPTTVATPAAGYADRVSDSISDFLPIFHFAINAVTTSDDRKSLTVNFNPVRSGRNLFGLQATATEPEVSEELSDAIAEGARSSETERIQDGLGDFDDLTGALTYAYQSDLSICERDGAVPGRCDWADVRAGTLRRAWGRDPKIYQHLVDTIWETALRASVPATTTAVASVVDELAELAQKLGWEEFDSQTVTFAEIEAKVEEFNEGHSGSETGEKLVFDRAELGKRIRADVEALSKVRANLAAIGVDRISDLILAQPLLSGTATYRARDPKVGADEFAASVRLEWGRHNFNHLLRRYRTMVAADPSVTVAMALKALNTDADVFSGDRFALVATWLRVQSLAFAHPYVEVVTDPVTGESSEFDRIATVQADERRELRASLLWSHTLASQKAIRDGVKLFPRTEVSLEYVDVSDDPSRQDRFIGRATYSYPLTDTMSLPLSLVYASDPELRGDVDKEFSAHFGLSLKLKRGEKD